ncbi:MAG: hypothetical protein WCD18_28445 [Thermosynechococcaceae cyanobacterium]
MARFLKVDRLVQKASSSIAQVRQDPSVRVTFYLLLAVIALGAFSALIGFLFGHESLKGVTQPDMNPFVSNSSTQNQYPRQGNYLLKESDILAKVERETKGIVKSGDVKQSAKDKDKKDDKSKDSKASPTPSSSPVVAAALPLSVQSQGIKLDIRDLSADADGVTLTVEMKNNGAQPVQFLYDFLDISDDQSQFFSAEVKGLPTKFPAKSETFNGAIRVLGVSPNSSKWISLDLSDYPDQKVQLKVPKILLKP